MKPAAIALIAILAALPLTGCKTDSSAPPSAGQGAPGDAGTPGPITPPQQTVIATVNGLSISQSDLQQPLMEAYGLNVLLGIVRLDLVKQEAADQNIVVSPDDIQAETDRTLQQVRKYANSQAAQTQPSTQPDDAPIDPADREKLTNMLLNAQHITQTEFDVLMETSAYLRKMVSPTAAAAVTDDKVLERFHALYGQKAHVRWIRVNTMLEIARLENELKGGATFENLVQLHAIDSNGEPASGEPPPFDRQDIHYPPQFRMEAFALKPGEISAPVNIHDALYLIQLVELIEPQHANFADYKDIVRQDLYDQTVSDLMAAEWQKVGKIALASLDIQDPMLRKQWETRVAAGAAELRNAAELQEQLKKQQEQFTTMPSTTP